DSHLGMARRCQELHDGIVRHLERELQDLAVEARPAFISNGVDIQFWGYLILKVLSVTLFFFARELAGRQHWHFVGGGEHDQAARGSAPSVCAATRAKWHCRSCLHAVGKPSLNFAEKSECYMCKRPKSAEPGPCGKEKSPSVSIRRGTGSGKPAPWARDAEEPKLQHKLQTQLQQKAKLIHLLREVDGQSDIAAARKRLQAVGQELAHAKIISGSAAEALAEQTRMALRQIGTRERDLLKTSSGATATRTKLVDVQAGLANGEKPVTDTAAVPDGATAARQPAQLFRECVGQHMVHGAPAPAPARWQEPQAPAQLAQPPPRTEVSARAAPQAAQPPRAFLFEPSEMRQRPQQAGVAVSVSDFEAQREFERTRALALAPVPLLDEPAPLAVPAGKDSLVIGTTNGDARAGARKVAERLQGDRRRLGRQHSGEISPAVSRAAGLVGRLGRRAQAEPVLLIPIQAADPRKGTAAGRAAGPGASAPDPADINKSTQKELASAVVKHSEKYDKKLKTVQDDVRHCAQRVDDSTQQQDELKGQVREIEKTFLVAEKAVGFTDAIHLSIWDPPPEPNVFTVNANRERKMLEHLRTTSTFMKILRQGASTSRSRAARRATTRPLSSARPKTITGKWKELSATSVTDAVGPLYLNPDRPPRTQRMALQTKRLKQILKLPHPKLAFWPNRAKGEVELDRIPGARALAPEVPDTPFKIEWNHPEADRAAICKEDVEAEFKRIFEVRGRHEGRAPAIAFVNVHDHGLISLDRRKVAVAWHAARQRAQARPKARLLLDAGDFNYDDGANLSYLDPSRSAMKRLFSSTPTPQPPACARRPHLFLIASVLTLSFTPPPLIREAPTMPELLVGPGREAELGLCAGDLGVVPWELASIRSLAVHIGAMSWLACLSLQPKKCALAPPWPSTAPLAHARDSIRAALTELVLEWGDFAIESAAKYLGLVPGTGATLEDSWLGASNMHRSQVAILRRTPAATLEVIKLYNSSAITVLSNFSQLLPLPETLFKAEIDVLHSILKAPPMSFNLSDLLSMRTGALLLANRAAKTDLLEAALRDQRPHLQRVHWEAASAALYPEVASPGVLWANNRTLAGAWPTSFQMHVGIRHLPYRFGCEGCNDEIVHDQTCRRAWRAVCQATWSFAHSSVLHRLAFGEEPAYQDACRRLQHGWRASTTFTTFFATVRVHTSNRRTRQSQLRGSRHTR
ncbi:unnamed protein product, partial [Prorocentrum cordatum]